MVDADRGVELEVSDFHGESRTEVNYDWLHSLDNLSNGIYYILSEEHKLFFFFFFWHRLNSEG